MNGKGKREGARTGRRKTRRRKYLYIMAHIHFVACLNVELYSLAHALGELKNCGCLNSKFLIPLFLISSVSLAHTRPRAA
jgi:hypothetical protein